MEVNRQSRAGKKVVFTESELLEISKTRGEGKAKLVEIARSLEIHVVPDSMNNRQIIDAILKNEKETEKET